MKAQIYPALNYTIIYDRNDDGLVSLYIFDSKALQLAGGEAILTNALITCQCFAEDAFTYKFLNDGLSFNATNRQQLIDLGRILAAAYDIAMRLLK